MKPQKRSQALRAARLFAEPESLAHHPDAYLANIDGAARGNPGPASYGVVLRRPDGRPLDELKKYVGRTTNNVAEYYALIAALDYAAAHGLRALRVQSDSELLVRQMQGLYKVKSADLRPLHERARKLAQGLAWFRIEHVPREQNREADELANAALDGTGARPAFSGQPSAAGRQPSVSGNVVKSRTRNSKIETQTIRARWRSGALHPAEPLDLPENTEVEIAIRKSPKD